MTLLMYSYNQIRQIAKLHNTYMYLSIPLGIHQLCFEVEDAMSIMQTLHTRHTQEFVSSIGGSANMLLHFASTLGFHTLEIL